MYTNENLIDLQFGIKQLSGNRELLVRLLNKFVDEYETAPASLDALFVSEQYADARIIVHTMKGVSGNLGLTALFQCCKTVDQSLKQASERPEEIDEFYAVLEQTILAINALDQDDSVSASTESKESVADANVKLIAALKNHEFIPSDKLSLLLESITTDKRLRSDIASAINELDYQRALQLLNA